MPYDPQKHNRRSIRKKGYDYSQAGAYFVTVCTQSRQPILTDPIIAGILKDAWLALPGWFPTIGLDEFVIMPNHVHFVLWLLFEAEMVWGDHKKGDREGTPLREPKTRIQIYGQREWGDRLSASQWDNHVGFGEWVVPTPETTNDRPKLGDIVGAWKSLVTKIYLDRIKQHDPARRAKFWQRNYYDRIVRNDRALSAFRQYIHDNPKNWSLDPDNPQNGLQLPFPETIEDYLDDIRRHMNNYS